MLPHLVGDNTLVLTDVVLPSLYNPYETSGNPPIPNYYFRADNMPVYTKRLPYQDGFLFFWITQTTLFSFRWGGGSAQPTKEVLTLNSTGSIFTRVSVVPLQFGNIPKDEYHFLVCFINPDNTAVNKHVWFDVGGWHQENFTIPSSPLTPIAVGGAERGVENALYRYCMVFGRRNILGLPSPIVEVRGSPNNVGIDVYIAQSFPSDSDRILLYRQTSVIPQWQLVVEDVLVPPEDFNKWYYEDRYPADYVFGGVNSPPFGSVNIANDPIGSMANHANRLVLGVNNVLKISAVGKLVFKPEPIEDNDGQYLYLDAPIYAIINWGSYMLVATSNGWYRVVETEGYFFSVYVDLPVPINRWSVRETTEGIFILSSTGVYLLTPNDELVLVSNIDLRRILKSEQKLLLQPLFLMLTQERGRDYLNIVFPAGKLVWENQNDPTNWTAWQCIKICLQTKQVSGYHTDIVWG